MELLPAATNRFELASYLHGRLSRLDKAVIEGASGAGDPGFWAALSLFYFETLTPGYRENGNRILADNCYIPEVDTMLAGVRYFRHRLAGAHRLFDLHGELSRPLLLSKPGVSSGLYMEINRFGVLHRDPLRGGSSGTCCILNRSNQRLKLGWNSKEKPGTLPRLLAVIDQLDLTYDLQGISGERLSGQLPIEFGAWLSRPEN